MLTPPSPHPCSINLIAGKSCTLCFELNSFERLWYQLKQMLYLKGLSWSSPSTCSKSQLPVCVLSPLVCLAGICLCLFPWLLLVMLLRFAKLFPPWSPCSQMSMDAERAPMGALPAGLAERCFQTSASLSAKEKREKL